MLIPYHFELFNGVFWFQVENFASRGKPRYKTPSLIFDVAIKKYSPLLPRVCQGPRKSIGSEEEAISKYFQRGH